MKASKIILFICLLAAPAAVFAQVEQKRESSEGKSVYHKKSYRKTVRATKKDSIKVKENAPIQNDNGTFSTTGTIDGRSATGRPGSDTLVNYKVKRKKTTIITTDGSQPPAAKPRKKQP